MAHITLWKKNTDAQDTIHKDKSHRKRKSIASKILFTSLGAIIFVAVTVTALALIPFTKSSKEAVQLQTEIGVRSLENLIANRLSDAEGMASALLVSGQVREIIENQKSLTDEQLREIAKKIMKNSGNGDPLRTPDLLAIVDAGGKVVVRGHSDKAGDDLLKVRDTVRQSLEGNITSDLEPGGALAWTASATGPVYDIANNIIGVVVVGYDMGNPLLVEQVKKTVGVDITIFKEDECINTTLIGADGKRIIGTKLDPAIAKTVLKDEKNAEGEIDVLGEPYIGSYFPLRNRSGKVVGICFAGGSLKETLENRNKTLLQVVGASVLLVLLFGFILFFIARRMSRPLRALVPIIERLEKGDFSMTEDELNIKSNDEIGHVAELISHMIVSIRGVIKSASDAGHEVTGKSQQVLELANKTQEAAVQIAKSSEQLMDMSRDNAAALEEANASVEEIASGATMGAEGASRGAESAQTAVDKANESSALAHETTQNITSIGKESARTMDVVREMQAAVESITSFVGTITSIADQTNLLALNAAIEAARAGDAGRGFAVVAEEVRKLAEGSGQAAKEVRKIVGDLSTSASNTHSSMELVDNLVSKTIGGAKTADEKLKEALVEVEKISDALQSIAAAAEEQAAASSEASTGIDAATQSVSQEAVTVENIASIAKSAQEDAETVLREAAIVRDIALDLEEKLSHFTL